MKEYIKDGKKILEVMPGWIEHFIGNGNLQLECTVHPTIYIEMNPFDHELHPLPNGEWMCHECYLKFKSGDIKDLRINNHLAGWL